MNEITFGSAITGASSQPVNPKLVSAAHEFEASLMKEFLKPLQQDSLFSENAEKGDDDSGGNADALMSFGSETMARAISERGGFGIATKILDHFKASENHAPSTRETKVRHS